MEGISSGEVITVSVTDRRPVVVGVDGSQDAWRAVDYGAWEAQQRGLPLRIVHGYTPPAVYGVVGVGYDDPDLRDSAQEVITDAIERARAGTTVDVSGDVLPGDPAGVLIESSRTASLVVVGSRGLGGFGGLLAGSVSARVAMHASSPVVVLRPAHELDQDEAWHAPGHGPVVLGVDGSPQSLAAIGFAMEEAMARRAALIPCYVWHVPPARGRQPDPDARRAEAERMLADALAPWREKYPEVEVHPHAVHGDSPLRAMIDLSARAGLVVVGARGHGGFVGLLLGSVSDGLVRHAHAPVAVVHGI